jgi:hypothetical protein
LADQAVSKLRAKGRGGSASRLSPPVIWFHPLLL